MSDNAVDCILDCIFWPVLHIKIFHKGDYGDCCRSLKAHIVISIFWDYCLLIIWKDEGWFEKMDNT